MSTKIVERTENYVAPACPVCNGELEDVSDIRIFIDFDEPPAKQYKSGCKDFRCDNCNLFIDSVYAYPDESEDGS